MTAPHRAAWLDLDGTHNIRDVGGLRTVDGGRIRSEVLLRGDHLENLTDDAARLLRVRTGLRLVVDLRSPQEKPLRGRWTEGPAGTGVEHLALPMVDLTRTADSVRALRGDERTAAVYRTMLDAAGATLARILTEVTATAERRPVLVHCAAGKDRTGIAVAVLLRAVGTRDADILADYAATGERLPRIRAAIAARAGHRYETPEGVATIEPLPVAPMQGVLDALDAAGGTTAFLAGHGVAPDTVAHWRGLLAEDPAHSYQAVIASR